MPTNSWKTDNYKFVGKAFDFNYANRLNKLMPILGQRTANSVDYEIEGTGGFGELIQYDGANLNNGEERRGFKTIVTPQEFSKSIDIGYKQAKIDKSGSCRKVGTKLGNSAAMTVYLHALRTLGGAFNAGKVGGDGKAWAATDHPVASKGSEGRTFIADPDAGTYSNLITSALSVAAITEAQTMANRFVTPDGLPFACDFDTLLVSPELEPTAKKICGENAKLYPGETENVNPVASMHYIVVGGGNDGFSAKQWAVCDRMLMKEIFLLIYNTKPMVLNSELDNPLIDKYTAYVDFGIGWGDGRPIIFSNPN